MGERPTVVRGYGLVGQCEESQELLGPVTAAAVGDHRLRDESGFSPNARQIRDTAVWLRLTTLVRGRTETATA